MEEDRSWQGSTGTGLAWAREGSVLWAVSHTRHLPSTKIYSQRQVLCGTSSSPTQDSAAEPNSSHACSGVQARTTGS